MSQDTMTKAEARRYFNDGTLPARLLVPGRGPEVIDTATARRHRKTMADTASEHDEQVAFFQQCAFQENQIPELRLVFAVPNGGHRFKAQAGKLKAEGVKAGVPDIFLPVARAGHFGLWIEMKVAANKPTQAQRLWHVMLRAEGYRVEVCYSAEEAWGVVMEYLGRDGR